MVVSRTAKREQRKSEGGIAAGPWGRPVVAEGDPLIFVHKKKERK